MANRQKEENNLRFGDYVTFFNQKGEKGGMLCAEGILLEHIFLKSNITTLDDALFCIHLQRQYSASKEYNDYMESIVDEPPEVVNEPSALKYQQALERGMNNEIKLNNEMLKKCINESKVVRFGDVIQLFHCKSGKYVTIHPMVLANDERENMSVSLDAQGSIYSLLVVKPKQKTDRDGDIVRDASDMYLQVQQRMNEYLHSAERDPIVGHDREVNCSLETSTWRMNIFQSSSDAANSDLLLTAQLIYLNDPESQANLAICEPEQEPLDPDEDDHSDDGEDDEDEEGDEGDDSHVDDGDIDLMHRYGDLKLQPWVPGTPVDSRCLWVMEMRNITQGGPIYWRNVQVRLKNLSKACYLEVETRYDIAHDKESGEDTVVDRHVIKTTYQADAVGAMWNIIEPNSTSKTLRNSKPYQIGGYGGVYLQLGEELDEKIVITGTKDKDEALSLLIYRYSEEEEEFGSMGGDDKSMQQVEPLDVYVAMACRNYLQKYLDMTVIPSNKTTGTLWPTADRTDMAVLQMIIERTVNFSQGFAISKKDVVLGVDKEDIVKKRKRQKLLAEQGILDILLAIIYKLKPISMKVDAYEQANAATREPFTDDENAAINMGKLILGLCFRLLYYCILDNPKNQLHIADNLPVLLAHLGSQPLAGTCVTEMLSKNQELQETKITTREIDIFVAKLRGSKMNPMYLQLLRACCSCMGNGVDGNQCKVVDRIFENTNDIIIEINADYSKLAPVPWSSTRSGLYIPQAEIAGSPIEGKNLLHNGLPALSLSWTTNSIDFSPLGLFGKLSVNVLELYRADQPEARSKSMSKAKKKANTQKAMVADYFVNQLYLAAEMCMDRNYVAMHRLDALFPYDVLCTLLKMPVQDKLKAAAARLVLCLHVDRDPQAGTKIPVLTRMWTDVAKSAVPKLPFVEPQRQYFFALLQQMLSEHVEGMAGRRWTDFSRRMLNLLNMMVGFKFYGDLKRMGDVIGPLILAIDRRKMSFGKDAKDKNSSNEGKSGKAGNQAVVEDGAMSSKSQKPDPTTSNKISENKVVPLDSSSSKYALDSGKEESKEEDETYADDSLEDEDAEFDMSSWQGRTLAFMEGTPFLLCILSLVAVAVGITVYTTISGEDDTTGTKWYWIGIGIFAIFLIDITLRGYCHWYTKGELKTFIQNSFNQIDIIVVLIDIVFLAIPDDASGNSSSAQYTKTLRLVRMVRLLRILRAARVINALSDLASGGETGGYKEPSRFSKAPSFELDTMNEMVDILLYTQSVMQDRNLSIFLRRFYQWVDGEEKTPGEIFFEVLQDSEELTLAINDFDNIFIDVLMFKHKDLTQGALDLLMLRNSTQKTLLENARETQLLVSSKRERQFREIDQILQRLERNAETHELWGELQSDSDIQLNKQTKDFLIDLTDMCKSKNFTYDSRSDCKPEAEIQNLLRNLGLYGICLKVLGLMDGVEEDDDGEFDEVALNTKHIVKLCNNLLYWACIDNAKNQEQLYDSLGFFMDTLNDGLDSHMCIRAIFSKNEFLMKLVPHVHLNELVNQIINEEKSHYFLCLAVSITNVGERNVVENQFEIVRTLTMPGRLQKVGSFLVPVNHREYGRKRDMMLELDPNKEYSIEELPSELAYHLALLEVLAGCTAGRNNVSSIEAKIQSIFSYIDVVEAILDPACVLIAKVETSRFLLNAIIEVELVVPGLGYSKCMWRLITSYIQVLGNMVDNLKRVDSMGWEFSNVSRQYLEYQLIGIAILSIFFDTNYKHDFFTDELPNTEGQLDRVAMTQLQATNIIKSLYSIIREIHKLNSPRLNAEHKAYIKKCVFALNKSVNYQCEADLDVKVQEEERRYKEEQDALHVHEDVGLERRVLNKYDDFMAALDEDEDVIASTTSENDHFIAQLENLPYIKDKEDGDIRYEALIRKLVLHVRENMEIIDEETRLSSRCTKTTLWVIKSFRTMIERKMGMTIEERDEEGGDEEDEAAEPVVTAFNTTGVTELCLDLIADGVDEALQVECIKLLVGVLFKEGGNRVVQDLMCKYLSRPDAYLFFAQARAIINKLKDWHTWNYESLNGEVIFDDPPIPDSILLIRMLQLMSEGHYLPNQDIVRDQPHSPQPINLLDDLVGYLKCLSQIPCRTSTSAAIRVANTILEVLQGPCKENQTYLCMFTDLLEILNRIIRSTPIKDCDPDEELELQITVIDILEGILEAQPTNVSPLYERVLSVVHADALRIIALPEPPLPPDASENEMKLQIECLVILQMLIEYSPGLREELDIPLDVTDGTVTASVEVLWNGSINRVFFHIPSVCHLLSKQSKDQLVVDVDRRTQELKLIDFLDRAEKLYQEVVHQRSLVEMGIAWVFSIQNQNYVTWAAFILAMTQNVLFLCYYDRQHAGDEIDDVSNLITDGVPVMPENIDTVVFVLNLLQIFCASFINVMMFVVRSPVKYRVLANQKDDKGFDLKYTPVEAMFWTFVDPMTMYYIVYNILAVLALTTNNYYSTLLLLDIVMKDKTAQNVIMSVYRPIDKILASLLVTVFVCYIFAFYMFIYFPTEQQDGHFDCATLFGCSIFSINYGIRAGEGLGEEMEHNLGQRWLFDVIFFFAITTGTFTHPLLYSSLCSSFLLLLLYKYTNMAILPSSLSSHLLPSRQVFSIWSLV